MGGVSFQPQFGSGRSTSIDPQARLTHTGVLARLGPQTGGLVTWRDLTALPCSHPHCCSIGYLLQTDAGTWRSLPALVGHQRLQEHLELVSNRIVDPELSAELRAMVKQSLLGLFSESSSLAQPSIGELFSTVCQSCDLGLSDLVRLAGGALLGRQERLRELLGARVKRITVKPFMDVQTMLEERLMQCCVHVGTARERTDPADPALGATAHQCVPFCAAQAWPALGRMKLSERARGADLPAAEEVAR